jgi:DNA-binding transcriptional LysR family regulator
MKYQKAMKSPKFNWEDARFFLAVARAGQIGKAAESLGVSAITLSRHLSQLQARTQSQLLRRHNKGFHLTDEGKRLVAFLERAEAEIEAAGEIFGSNPDTVAGTVRIAAPEGFALKVLTPNLNRLLNEHPQLNVEIVPQSVGFSLSRREADLAVMVGRPSESRLASVSLGGYWLKLFASQAYVDAHGAPESIEQLSQHRLIGYVEDLLFSDRLNTARAVWSNWQSQVAIYSPIGQVEAVKAGLGIGVLHGFLVSDTDNLINLLPEVSVEREFFLAYHQSTERIPRIRVTIDFLKQLNALR